MHAHWNNTPLVNMLLHSDALSWFGANQSWLFLLNATCLEQNFTFFCLTVTRQGLEPTIYRTRGEHADHYHDYFTDAISSVDVLFLKINKWKIYETLSIFKYTEVSIKKMYQINLMFLISGLSSNHSTIYRLICMGDSFQYFDWFFFFLAKVQTVLETRVFDEFFLREWGMHFDKEIKNLEWLICMGDSFQYFDWFGFFLAKVQTVLETRVFDEVFFKGVRYSFWQRN